MNERENLPKTYDGSPEKPIRFNASFDVWSLTGFTDKNIYVEEGKQFSDAFWHSINVRNCAVIYVKVNK